MATFLICHGAWSAGWAWKKMRPLLRAAGHEVFNPTYTGLGERAHLSSRSIALDTHIADIVNEIRWKDLQNVVLVGHSYGGMVITGVAEQVAQQIGAIVYLDAFVPESGKSASDLVGPGVLGAADPLPPVPAEVFQVNAADRAWVQGKLTPQPAATFTQKLTHAGAYDRIARKTYIRPLDFPAPFFDAACAPLRRNPGWRVHDIRGCGHDVMVDKPDELARLLEGAA